MSSANRQEEHTQPEHKLTRKGFLKTVGAFAGSAVLGTAFSACQTTEAPAAGNEPAESGAAARSTDLKEDLAVIDDYSRLIKKNLVKEPQGQLRRPYLTPGQRPEDKLVDWDAVWSGMSYLIDGDPEPLRGSLLNILDFVDEDGKGTRVIGPEGAVRGRAFTNRPFVATGAFVLSRETGSTDWLSAEHWQNLRRLMLYWHEQRTGPHDLLQWMSVDEGFADNGLANFSLEQETVEGVDLNAQMVLEHTAAAWIAEQRGRSGEAREQRDLARKLATRLQEVLWDEEQGEYFSYYTPSPQGERTGQRPGLIRRRCYTNLWPLWLGLAPEERARRVIENYVVQPEHYWSDYGIRSTPKSETVYNNALQGITVPYLASEPDAPWPTGLPIYSSNWLGPLWTIANYLTSVGLWQYGYQDEAETVARRIVKRLADDVRENGDEFHNGLRVPFYENYDAETGEGNALWGGVGIGSWHVMIRYLPDHISGDETFVLRGLDLPTA